MACYKYEQGEIWSGGENESNDEENCFLAERILWQAKWWNMLITFCI